MIVASCPVSSFMANRTNSQGVMGTPEQSPMLYLGMLRSFGPSTKGDAPCSPIEDGLVCSVCPGATIGSRRTGVPLAVLLGQSNRASKDQRPAPRGMKTVPAEGSRGRVARTSRGA